MCDKRPGVRCSDYATSTLRITKKRLERVQQELSDYEAKYEDSLANKENPTARDTIRQEKHQRLQESVRQHQEIVDAAEFEYHSCPAGQAELKEDLQKAIEAGDVPRQEELQAQIQAGEDYRARARENLRDLEKVEAEQGPEAAITLAMDKIEQATEIETEALILGQKSQIELDAARAEAEEYQRAMEEYRKHDRIDTPEEELEKARKRKMQLLVIGTLAAAVISYSLVRQAASGEKSTLLQYGKTMVMRQVMTGGRQYIMPLLKGDKKEEDARELRAEKEAEDRAAAARERVIRKHEQQLAEEERKQIRDEERRAELMFRNTIREQEREAERQKRAEEIAHYEELAKRFKDVPLTPEMEATLESKKPARYRKPSANQNSRNKNSGNKGGNGERQYSSRKQNRPTATGPAAQPQPTYRNEPSYDDVPLPVEPTDEPPYPDPQQ